MFSVFLSCLFILLSPKHSECCIFTSAFFARLSRTAEENQIDLRLRAATHTRFLASAKPSALRGKSFTTSQSAPFSAVILFVFACALLCWKNLFKKFLFRCGFVMLQDQAACHLILRRLSFLCTSSPGLVSSRVSFLHLCSFGAAQEALPSLFMPFSHTHGY